MTEQRKSGRPALPPGLPKTPAQRQAERKARELAAGKVQWKRWVHHDDVPALTEYAEKLARKRARSEKAG
jgi:hypothetical protein